jgi:hypothetical protein
LHPLALIDCCSPSFVLLLPAGRRRSQQKPGALVLQGYLPRAYAAKTMRHQAGRPALLKRLSQNSGNSSFYSLLGALASRRQNKTNKGWLRVILGICL